MSFLEKVCSAFSAKGLSYALVGGHAVALHGAVRGTVDIDFVFKWNQKTILTAQQVLTELGLISRLPIDAEDVYKFRDEYISKRNLIAWNFYNPANLTEQVDIIINYDLKPSHVELVNVGATHIPLMKAKSLIKMKTESGREQDLADVKALKFLVSQKQKK